jgi:hypothetical protein
MLQAVDTHGLARRTLIRAGNGFGRRGNIERRLADEQRGGSGIGGAGLSPCPRHQWHQVSGVSHAGAIVPRMARLAVYLLHHRVLFEVRLSELMADLLGVQRIASVARHPSAGAAVKQTTTPAFASAAGQTRGQQCPALRAFRPPKTAARSSPQPAVCDTLAFCLSPVATFCPQNLAKI